LKWGNFRKDSSAVGGEDGNSSSSIPEKSNKKSSKKAAKSSVVANQQAISALETCEQTGAAGVMPRTKEHNKVFVMLSIIKALLCRSNAFSSIVLSSVMKKELTPSCAAALLRLFLTAAKSVCCCNSTSGAESDDETSTRGEGRSNVFELLSLSLSDAEVRRAIVWIEALLDSHFSSLALSCATNTASRNLIISAMRATTEAEDGIAQLSKLQGTWMHISRLIYNGGEQVRPITGLYQVEALSLL
jgi:hypothetical protein